MHDTRHGSTTAIVDISHGARDSTCGRDTAKEWYHDIGNTLRDEFGIGIMLITYHAICHHG